MFVTLDFINFKFDNNELYVLLSKRENKELPAYGEYSIQGGMVWEAPIEGSDEYDENLEQASTRILKAKLGGIEPCYVEQLPAVGCQSRDSRGWSVTLPHLSLIGDPSRIDGENNIWVPVTAILENKNLPFDHSDLVEESYNTLRNKAKYSSILLYLLGESFTIAHAVEIFSYFGLKVSKQTVHNRWVKSGLLENTGDFFQQAKGGQPSALYRLKEKSLSYFEVAIGNL